MSGGVPQQRVLSFSQNREDVLLWRALHTIDPSTVGWIDIGAAHPKDNSVTKWFSLQGWRGVNVEPVPSSFAALVADRPNDVNLNVAVGSELGRAQFGVVLENTELSSFNEGLLDYHSQEGLHVEQVDVEVVTLSTVFERYATEGLGHCAFLKVDVEGREAAVLGGLDWQTHRPWIVMVEATMPEQWRPQLELAGYEFTVYDGVNLVFVATEQMARFGSLLTSPVSCMDDYQVHLWELAKDERRHRQGQWAIEHVARVIAGGLIAEPSTTCRALAALLVHRTDLQRVFGGDLTIDRRGLLGWATTTTVAQDPEIALLHDGMDELHALLAKA